MNPILTILITFLAAYLIGAIPFGYLVARARGVDILQKGSGNIGATNVGRVLGRRFGIAIFLLDFLKGAGPTAAVGVHAVALSGLAIPLAVVAAIGAFIGHLFPVYLRFRGGKGVATGAGAVVVLTPTPAALALLTWVAAVVITRYVSAASLLACLVLCVARVALTGQPWGQDHVIVTVFCLVAAGLVAVRHHANIRRLLRGNENRLPETPAMLQLSKIVHVVAVGLWFGTLVFFVIVGLQLFGHFEKDATNAEHKPFGWVPQVWPYNQSRPLSGTEKLPEWLRKEPGTRAAGFAVAALFPWYFGIQYACSILAAGTALTWAGAGKCRVHRIRAVVLVAALICVAGGGWLERLVAEKTGPRDTAIDTALRDPTADNIARAADARADFWKLHGYSMMLNMIVLLLVTTGMVLTSNLPTKATPATPSPNGHAGPPVAASAEAASASGILSQRPL